MTNVQKIRQKVFDKALAHLRKQGKKSMGFIGCSYRGEGGLKCAIGIFITDSKYKNSFEGATVDEIMDVLPDSVSSAGKAFLIDLQSQLHDDVSFVDFPARLEQSASDLADKYNLKYSATGAAP
jgi:hypothetical protein